MADKSRLLLIVQLMLAVLLLIPHPAAFAAEEGERHVLILHPFTPTEPAHMEFNEGLTGVLNRSPRHAFSYSYEYFDYARHSNEPDFFENMAAYLRVKYKLHRPDFIVTEFNMVPLLRHLGDLFGDIPVIMNWNQFSEYLRGSFDFKNLEDYTSLKKELEFVHAYLEIEKARFGERLQTVIRVDEEALDMRVPPLVLQPLVENAVHHGIMKRIEGGCVEISVKRNGKEAEFTVRDNGVGMSAERAEALLAEQAGGKPSRSVGVRNIHMRLKKLYGKGIQLISEAGKGTTVTFAVPLDGGNGG
jgi:hypothetical protein